MLTSSRKPSTTLPASLRRKKRQWTTEGRVVYERKKHVFTAADASRVSLAVLRLSGTRLDRNKKARSFLETLFRTLLGFLIPHELWPVVGEPIVRGIMILLDWGVTLMKDAAEELKIDPRASLEVVDELEKLVSGKSH